MNVGWETHFRTKGEHDTMVASIGNYLTLIRTDVNNVIRISLDMFNFTTCFSCINTDRTFFTSRILILLITTHNKQAFTVLAEQDIRNTLLVLNSRNNLVSRFGFPYPYASFFRFGASS